MRARTTLMVAGLLVATGGVFLLTVNKAAPTLPPADPPAQPLGEVWEEIPPGEVVTLRAGERLRAAIDLPWGVGMLVSESKARAFAAERNFALREYHEKRPASWPAATEADEDADLFVVVDNHDGYRAVERPGAVVRAWRRRLV